jgi:hypothetical protein
MDTIPQPNPADISGDLTALAACIDTLQPMGAAAAPDLSYGLAELAELISFRVGAWHDFGYETPPAPHCKPVPPLGERSAEAIKAGHAAIEAIDELTRQLWALRSQLVDELRADDDARAVRVDALLASYRDGDR